MLGAIDEFESTLYKKKEEFESLFRILKRRI